MFVVYLLHSVVHLLHSTHSLLLSVDTVLHHNCSSSLANIQLPRDVTSFSSSTSSPWESPEEPPQVLKPAPARARSAPLTLPTDDPVKSPVAHSPPKSVDAFSTVCWSQSQWIAFNDSFAPVRNQSSGPPTKEPQRQFSTSGRSSRLMSDESSEVCGKAVASRDDCLGCFSDVFCGISETPAVPTNIAFNGNLASWGRT